MDAAFPFPFPLAAAAAEGSSDLREEADGGRLLVRRPGGAAEVAELMAIFAAEVLGARDAAAAGEAGAEGAVVILLRFNWRSFDSVWEFCVSVTLVLGYHANLPMVLVSLCFGLA